MRRIPTDKGDILLPEDWMELTEAQRRRGFELLALVMAGALDPFAWQLQMLQMITGYKPGRTFRSNARAYGMTLVRDNILENLRRLAECLTFAFSIEEDKIQINYEMRDCPFELFKGKGVQPHFIRDRLIETNLTAGNRLIATTLLRIQESCLAMQSEKPAGVSLGLRDMEAAFFQWMRH